MSYVHTPLPHLNLTRQFGPAVFLDPTWAVGTLVRGRSRAFVAVWDQLHSLMLSRKPTMPRVRQTGKAVVAIMTVLGGKPIGDHVKQFLESIPPRPGWIPTNDV